MASYLNYINANTCLNSQLLTVTITQLIIVDVIRPPFIQDYLPIHYQTIQS